jgi:hypothetical protein
VFVTAVAMAAVTVTVAAVFVAAVFVEGGPAVPAPEAAARVGHVAWFKGETHDCLRSLPG